MWRIAEVFKALNKAKVDYLLVGGLASILYGVPRSTVDIDIVVRPNKTHVRKAIKALSKLGLSPDTAKPDEILAQGGVTFMNDRELDMLTDIKGMDFDEAWKDRKTVDFERTRVIVVSKDVLRKMLTAVGRPKDLDDLKQLDD